MLIASGPGRLDDAAAIAVAKPKLLIEDKSLSPEEMAALLEPIHPFYGFWNNASQRLLDQAISPDYNDHTLPEGRPAGPKGVMIAAETFLRAVPDLRVEIPQRVAAGDRVISQLHITGHFTGTFEDITGDGRPINFIAIDILQVRDGRITDNWHLEDNLTFQKQVGAI